MKKLFLGFILGIGMTTLSLFGGSVFSHQIPPELLEFLATNPNASESDVELFLEKIFPDNEFDSFEDDLEILSESDLPDELLVFITENQTTTEAQINQFITLNPAIGDKALSVFQNIYPEIFEQEILENSATFWNNARNFVYLGVIHILEGIDHVLFVLALVLVWMPIRKLLLVITTFTLAHSVTLILAGTDILRLSSAIVEPIIALSIAYVALTTVFSQEKSWFRQLNHKLGIIFLFGLFHGLGFAGVFGEIGINSEYQLSSLLFFNVGVEFGQVIILLGALPILFRLRKLKWANIIIEVIAIIISLFALYWFFERISWL